MNLFFRSHGAGPPLIILHGLFGTADNWASIAKVLSEQRTVFLIDLRNHGNSPHNPEFTYEAMVNDLHLFLKQHDIIKPDILGHSMGGKVAMHFACSFPDQINKLIVVDIAPKAYPVHHDSIIEGLMAINLVEIQSRKEADTALAEYIEEDGVRQFLLKNLKRTDNGFEWKMNLPVIHSQIENVGKGLNEEDNFGHKTLFIRGSLSNYILDSDEDDIKNHFPLSSIITIENAGHWVHAEQPEALLKVVKSFLES